MASHDRRRVIILGAAGRDFHNFNVAFRDDERHEVVAFTATQIPGISGRRYPASLAGPRYPEGIAIRDEAELEALCRDEAVDEAIFAYSDIRHEAVMHIASRVLAAGADFRLMGPDATMLTSARPVVAVSAIRTGCGKSQTARYIAGLLRERGLRVAALRHPMPYGDLERARLQRFAEPADLEAGRCTVEEREEYEPYLAMGSVIYAGVDYGEILAAAEREADVIVWDGGNNDFPFLRPDLHIVLADALRPGQADGYHPGEATLRMADVIAINKVNSAQGYQVDAIEAELRAINPEAPILRCASEVVLDDPDAVRGRRALVIEDGPTMTHGGMASGAGLVAAERCGGVTVVDPRPFAAPLIHEIYRRHPHIGDVLPAVGYSAEQLEALRRTIADAPVDVVVSATPADLAALIEVDKPILRVRYGFADDGEPRLSSFLDRWLAREGLGAAESTG